MRSTLTSTARIVPPPHKTRRHTDYLHDGHLHHIHGSHVDELRCQSMPPIKTSARRSIAAAHVRQVTFTVQTVVPARASLLMGGVISRMKEVSPTARNSEKSTAIQTDSLNLFLQDDCGAASGHMRQIIHIPLCRRNAPGRFAVPASPDQASP